MDTASSTPSVDTSSVMTVPDSSSTPSTPVITVPSPTPAAKGSWGGLIGLILIVGLIVIAAFYVWGERVANHNAAPTAEEAGI